MTEQQDRIAKLMCSIFRGREDLIAEATERGFAPKRVKGVGPAWLEMHLTGQRCMGFYFMQPDSSVWCSAVDFDNKLASPDPQWRAKAETTATWLIGLGLSPLVEISASGQAAHVWLFFDEPCPAWLIRRWWWVVSQKTGVPFKEVYPRQDRLSGKDVGNLMRYPLWNQSRFVDAETWDPLDPEAVLAAVLRTSAAELKELAFNLGKPLREPSPEAARLPQDGEIPPRVLDRLSKAGTLLARRWRGDTEGLQDNSRSALAQSIACELVRQYVPTAEIEAALRHWCSQAGYDKGERDDWITRTVGKAYEYVLMRVEQKSSGTVLLRDACHAYLDKMASGLPQHIPSGIVELDLSCDGVGYGEMCVIAARPGHGKSALALQWIDRAAGEGIPGLIISEEMAAVQLGKRVLQGISSLEEQKWEAEYVPILRRDVDRHFERRAPVYVVESCNTVERAVDVIDQFAAVHGVRFVAVDYLQLLRSRQLKRYEQVTDISVQIAQATKRNSVAMLALCQMNREVESRDGQEPRLSDLRDSGQLEQDADLVIFVQWPRAMNDENSYRMFVKKRRNGAIRQERIATVFDPDKQRIGVLARTERQHWQEDN